MATAKKVVRKKISLKNAEPEEALKNAEFDAEKTQKSEIAEEMTNDVDSQSADSFVEPKESSELSAKSEDQQISEPEEQTAITSDASESTNNPTPQPSESSETSEYRPRYSRPSSSSTGDSSSNQRSSGGYSRGYDRGSADNRGYDRPYSNDRGYDNRSDRPSYDSNNSYAPRSGGYDRQEQQPNSGRDRFERDTEEEIQVPVKGILDIQHEGHGFLRPKFRASDRDIYISSSQIRRFWLRNGDLVEGVGRPPKDNERYFGLLKIEKVNDKVPEESLQRPHFDDLTAIYPDKQVMLATGKEPLSTRIIDLVSPIGFGQRGMIVSPPKAGKTTIMKNIAEGISANHPDVHLMAVLIGERPEEVTDISRSVKGEVIASNFDESPETQTRIAEIAMDRAKRLVEEGRQVVILLDSITRLARAYNLAVDPSGRTLSGGFDPAALYPAKKFFGAARNCEEGGSLTIIGTALVDTGSRMDDLIFEEFKGTGNMEVHLDRKLADRRVYPAINIERSGTREEARILSEDTLKKVILLRRMVDVLNPDERTEVLIERLQKTADNKDFLESLAIPKE